MYMNVYIQIRKIKQSREEIYLIEWNEICETRGQYLHLLHFLDHIFSHRDNTFEVLLAQSLKTSWFVPRNWNINEKAP